MLITRILKYNADNGMVIHNFVAYHTGIRCKCGACYCCKVPKILDRIKRKFGHTFNLLGGSWR